MISDKGLKLKAWGAISKYVRQRDGGRCVTCGKVRPWKEMDCGHYKRNSERNAGLGGNMLWYDLRNLNCQCDSCNRFKSSNPVPYALYLEEKYGMGILQEIDKLWLTPKKWTRDELFEIIKKYDSPI